MASALKYLHTDWDTGISIIHRDLKPDNIGFTSDGNIKLFDFGLCSVVKKFKSNRDVYQMTGKISCTCVYVCVFSECIRICRKYWHTSLYGP